MLNKLMLTTSIALISTTALATAQAQDAGMQAEMETSAEATMSSDMVKASDIVGADLEYADGASAITDIRMNDAGDPEALVISRGGFLGLFDEEVAVSTVAASIAHDS